MKRIFFTALFLCLAIALPGPVSMFAQRTTGTITGTVSDINQEALPGAGIVLTPGSIKIATDAHGNFAIRGVAPGSYTIAFSYVGFSSLTKEVTVAAGQVSNVNVVLQVASQKQEITVTSSTAHGIAEAINEERTTSNILDVLPAKVIRSLPNANVADAVGRLPGVTLERDEGEGKYVQVRGTAPELSNLTIDGIEVPSPEGGVRQVKLDTIPADLVQSVQIYKTIEADQPGDAIGGSVNITTKTAGDRPVLSLFSSGGFTPIDNTRSVYGFGGTAGRRFGAQKRVGVMFSASYDYNGRGINDIEPVPGFNSIDNSFEFTNMDIRDYRYDRKRYGFGANLDYRLNNSSTFYVRSLFSEFKDFGNRIDYALSTNDTIPGTNLPSFNTERRDGDFQIADLILGGDHTTGKWTFQWEGSVARSRMLNPINGGESIASFDFVPSNSNCQYDAAATTNRYLPSFTSACFTEMYNPANLQLGTTSTGTIAIAQTNHGLAAQLNLQGSVSAGRAYFAGSHPGVFQFGFWFSNAHKFDDSWENDYFANSSILGSQFVDPGVGYTHPYYGGSYTVGPWIDWYKINSYLAANPSAFTLSSTYGGNSNNFDLVERVAAGYAMNTISFSRFTLITGIRFEATHDDTLSFDTTLVNPCLCAKGTNSYLDPLPSASLQFKLDNHSDLRFAYARGISRPDPQFLTTATSVDQSYFPPLVTVGNPALKPEHANDFDVLYERYLNPVGVIRGGFFYKDISDPIVNLFSGPKANPACPQASCLISQAANAGSAHIAGVELSFEQHFTYLPGLLRGFGVLANYSYATSQASNINPGLRIDRPALLRQAPNTWNILPTYTFGRLNVGAGLVYNGPNIYAYNFVACQGAEMVDASGNCQPNAGDPVPDPTRGGLYGPSGDIYLYSHLQTDAQGSFYLGKGLTALVSLLNLNNEVFGFYQGSPQFFIQREYYQPTYSFGLRWDFGREK
ncbi:MAG: TonB-dependent receptor [Acidobacteria bacterium]|nr:MAG: TonB-dependent receptor [Acidobacteriota bacterium]